MRSLLVDAQLTGEEDSLEEQLRNGQVKEIEVSALQLDVCQKRLSHVVDCTLS